VSKRATGWYGAGTLARLGKLQDHGFAIGGRRRGDDNRLRLREREQDRVRGEELRQEGAFHLFHVKHGVTLRSPGFGGNWKR